MAFLVLLTAAIAGCGSNTPASSEQPAASGGAVELLNVSYDPTRELYQEFNAAFAKYWHGKTGQNGGHSAVARRLRRAGARGHRRPRSRRRHARAGLRHRRDRGSRPDRQPAGRSGCRRTARRTRRRSCSSSGRAIPKGIKDWSDLVKPGVGVITPNPKTSGGARWNYLAAWEYALRQPGGNDAKAQAVRDARCTRTCRCSTPARAARRRRSCSAASATCCWPGRTKPTWRSTRRKAQVEIVVPSVSILAEPPVDGRRQGRRQEGDAAVAEAYLAVLYTPEGQEIAAKHHYRPRDPQVAAKYAATFASVKLFTIDEAFGGWQAAQKTHFADGGDVRSDLPGRAATRYVDETDSKPHRPPGLPAHDGVHAVLPVPHRPRAAADAAGCGRRRWAGTRSGDRSRDPRVVASYRLSVGASLVGGLRQRACSACSSPGCSSATDFPGRRIVDALIDLPFALPTAVAGITLTTLYAPNGWLGPPLAAVRHQGGVHAARHHGRADLHRPAVRRPHAAAGHRGSRSSRSRRRRRASAPAAGRCVTRVILPYLYPAWLTGFALAFARAVGEYGSVVFISGNMPMRTEISPLLIITKLEQFDYAGATAIALVMLVDVVRAAARHQRAAGLEQRGEWLAH